MIVEDELPPIVLENVQNRYGKTIVTHGVTIEVPFNSIFALLGSNGSGKTTLIRTIAGIIRPTSGETRVFGIPSSELGREVFEKIGFVAEGQEAPLGFSLRRYLDYCKRMYPNWDESFETQLLELFQLPLDRKLKHFSRGMLVKAQLITAMAYHPQLLILDEPFSGLDPVVLEDVIDALLDITEQEKWTIFLSTHDIEEAERLADIVGILDEGSLLACLKTDEILERFKRVQIRNTVNEISITKKDEWLDFKQAENFVSYVDLDFDESALEKCVKQLGVSRESIDAKPMTLREIVISILRRGKPILGRG